jgi:hypothetical protein
LKGQRRFVHFHEYPKGKEELQSLALEKCPDIKERDRKVNLAAATCL